MNQEQIKAAREALDNMDDYARMSAGVDAIGPRGVLERFISEVERTSAPVSVMTDEKIIQVFKDEGANWWPQDTDIINFARAILAAAAPQAHAEPVANKVQNNPYTATFPNEIWLQVGDCGVNELAPYAETYRNTDMTWSSDSIDKYDVRYIRADLAAPLPPDRVGGEARDAALEDAAQTIENEACTCCWPEEVQEFVSHIAETIRKLKAKPNADCSTGSVKP